MHTATPEIIAQPEVVNLPLGRDLQGYYGLEFQAAELPDTFRMANPGERDDVALRPGVQVEHTPEHIEWLKGEFRRQAPRRACNDAWWVKANSYIRRGAEGVRSIGDIPLIGKHRADVMVDNQETGQGYDVIEMGTPIDPDIVDATLDTLKLIDQYSGGLLAARRQGTRIALVSGITLRNSHEDNREAGGYAVPGAAIINVDGIRRWDGVTEANYHQVLSTVIVHEVLGHLLEKEAVGDDNYYFKEHFDYSDNAARSVTPKDPAATGSKPVNDYGRINAHEDFGTSAEAMISHAMGWSSLVNEVSHMKSDPDEHRSKLVLGLMERAAKQAKKYDHTPGFVGSEVRYAHDNSGRVTGIEPVRTMHIRHMSGAEALQDELRRTADHFIPKDIMIVGSGWS